MASFREFLYRRDDLVEQFLAQIEGGTYDEEEITEQTSRTGGVGGGLNAGPASAAAARRTEGSREASRTVRQTPESRFNRLVGALQDTESLQYLDSLDEDIWNQLGASEFVEVRAELRLAAGVGEIESAGAAGGLAPLLDMLRNLPPSMQPADFDTRQADQMASKLPAVKQFADQFGNADIPCTFHPIGAPKFTFFAELGRQHLVGRVIDLEGEVTVIARIQRLIAAGHPETLGAGVVGLLRGPR